MLDVILNDEEKNLNLSSKKVIKNHIDYLISDQDKVSKAILNFDFFVKQRDAANLLRGNFLEKNLSVGVKPIT